MAPSTPADIAELQKALEKCCAELAQALDESEKQALEEAAAQGPIFDDEGEPLPSWRPLVLASIPGLDTLVSIIKPPLQIIVTILQIIAALLQVLAAILLGLPDPFKALILAAYELLKDIINDLLNTGAYMYFDAPGISPAGLKPGETGIYFDPGKDFKAGQELKAPPVTPDAFQVWASRWQASFDDPGDLERPVVTEGAPIQAVFVVMAAPSLDPLRQLIYLLGKLLNIDAFKRALDKFQQGVPDPRLARLRTKSTKPDWKAARLRDLFPPLEKLLILPEALLGLLLAVENLSNLLKAIAQALAEKAQILLQLADAVQAIIDLLDALKSTGMYVLNLSTLGGIPALKQGFMSAINRPPGGYMGGVCLLASGPNLGKAAMLWDLLGLSTAYDVAAGNISLEDAAKQAEQSAIGQALENAYQQGKDWVKQTKQTFKTEIEAEADAFKRAVLDAPQTFKDELGRTSQELADMADNQRSALVETIEHSEVFIPDGTHIDQSIEATKAARRRGARSLAIAVARDPDNLIRPPETPTVDPATGKGST